MTLQQKINRETMKLNLNWCNLLSDQLLLKTPYHYYVASSDWTADRFDALNFSVTGI